MIMFAAGGKYAQDTLVQNLIAVCGKQILLGHFDDLLKIHEIFRAANGLCKRRSANKVLHQCLIDYRQVVIEHIEFLYVGSFGFICLVFPQNQVIIDVFLKDSHKPFRLKRHAGALFPFPANCLNFIQQALFGFKNDSIGIGLNEFAIGRELFNEIQQQKLTADTDVIGLTRIV